MIDILVWSALVMGIVILGFGLLKILYVPLSLWFIIQQSVKKPNRWTLLHDRPLVSVIVPGYNEEPVLDNCVQSILASDYTNIEILLVDDGSSDSTFTMMQALAAAYPSVTALSQSNQGKGAALNYGARQACGEVLMFVDADGIFSPDTITEMLLAFDDPRVGAVSGDDRPVNLDRLQTRFLALISHVGTGLVRRSLTVLHCLPIVSGNAGAFRRSAFEITGPLHTKTVGEDLELTWRMHKAGFKVRFAPKAIVHAESPSTVGGLWKQRVRWGRGLLQVTALHRNMVGNLRYGSFGVFLIYNTVTMILIPVVQIAALVLIIPLILMGEDPLPASWWGYILWTGIFVAVLLLMYSIALNRAYADLRHLWTLPVWPIYTVFVSLTLVRAMWLELRGAPQRWNKLHRTGVVSITP